MVKQVIVIRRDLGMRRGKEIAQGAHASMKFLVNKIEANPKDKICEVCIPFTEPELIWLEGDFTKVVCQVPGEAELLDVHTKALAAGLTSCLIQDAGKTEFGGVPTYTAVGIGPDLDHKIDLVTGGLKLY